MNTLNPGDILTPIFYEIETIIGKDTYEMWIKPAQITLNGQNLVITLPNSIWQKTVQNRYEHIIKDAVLKHTGLEIIVSYHITEQKPTPVQTIDPLLKMLQTPAPEKPTPSNTAIKELVEKDAFDSRVSPIYRFDNFIVSSSNRHAYNTARTVVNDLGKHQNNPMFIYSTPGLGKTHLMYAIGNEILKQNPQAKVLYLSGEEFVNEYIEMLKDKKYENFRKKYRSLDCLLIDDIQFVVGKSASEEEFFNTFNALYSQQKQIVLSSDRSPQQLELNERLSSRLLSGIPVDIKKPNLETRIAILRQKRDSIGFDLGDDVISFIAEGIQTNIRELEGSLFRLMSYCNTQSITPTISIAREILSDILIQEEQRLAVNVNSIKKVVGKHFKIEMADFQSKRKTQSIAWPRQIAMFLSTELTDLSLPQIGQEFSRDHSTVVHARDLVQDKIKSDPFFAAEINQIISEIKAVEKK